MKAWILPPPDTIQAQLDQAIGYGFDGVFAYVGQAGTPPQYYSSCWHNRESKISAQPQALFKTASISKLYDVVAVTKLVRDGRLSLDTIREMIYFNLMFEINPRYKRKKVTRY